MKFFLTLTDEVDLALMHETLLHLMTEHPPLEIKITVEFETPCYDLGSSQLPEWSPDATSSQEPPEKTADGNPQEPPEKTTDNNPQEPSKSEEEI